MQSPQCDLFQRPLAYIRRCGTFEYRLAAVHYEFGDAITFSLAQDKVVHEGFVSTRSAPRNLNFNNILPMSTAQDMFTWSFLTLTMPEKTISPGAIAHCQTMSWGWICWRWDIQDWHWMVPTIQHTQHGKQGESMTMIWISSYSSSIGQIETHWTYAHAFLQNFIGSALASHDHNDNHNNNHSTCNAISVLVPPFCLHWEFLAFASSLNLYPCTATTSVMPHALPWFVCVFWLLSGGRSRLFRPWRVRTSR